MLRKGYWKVSTKSSNKDCCLLSVLPLYFETEDSPLLTERAKTIYFEVKLLSLGRAAKSGEGSSLALGFAAQPYPTWRMPGWNRGSLAVHSDDGRKYVNDDYGGKDFTRPFREGETLGLGMTFALPRGKNGQQQASPTVDVEIFFTRDGVKVDSWNLTEERDQDKDKGVQGLEGDYDLYAAVGVFGAVKFEVSFDRSTWLWQPQQQ